MLEVPEIINRYYTMQVMDEWGDVIANINPRTFPSHLHGTVTFVTPNATVKTPPDAARINNPSIIPAPPLPTFGSRELLGVEIFAGAEHVLATALDTLPGAAALQQKVRVVARYAESGRGARQEHEGLVRERVIPDVLDYASRESMGIGNHWRSSHPAGGRTAAIPHEVVKRGDWFPPAPAAVM